MMGEIFAAFGALEAQDRFELGAGLRDPFACFPVTEADFAWLGVPCPGPSQVTFLHRLQHALLPVVDSQLSSWTLGALVPRIVACAGVVESSPETTNRMVALVRANGYRTWSELAGCTIGEIRGWYGTGPQITSQLVVAAVAAALSTAQGAAEPSPTAPRAAPNPDCAALETFLADLPDVRGRFAFELDELRLGETPRRTATVRLPASHEFLGLSLERARQLKVAARDQLLAAARRDDAVAQCVGALAARLGLVTDRDGLGSALEELQLPPTSDTAGLLAVWLAGPYRPVPGHEGWWSPNPVELVADTERLLAMGGGVQPHDVVVKDLVRLGVTEAHADRWLAGQAVRIEHGLVIDLRGRPSDVAARALEARGTAMSSSEIRSWMSAEITPLALVDELSRNRVFVETGPDRWELTDWGGEPSGHLVRLGVQVTPEVVSGDEAELSSELAVLLRLRPGVPKTLATRFGPMVVSYDGGRVMRGSGRPIVVASGAEIGDVIVFVIDPRDLAVEVTVAAAGSASSTDQPVMIQSGPRVRSTA